MNEGRVAAQVGQERTMGAIPGLRGCLSQPRRAGSGSRRHRLRGGTPRRDHRPRPGNGRLLGIGPNRLRGAGRHDGPGVDQAGLQLQCPGGAAWSTAQRGRRAGRRAGAAARRGGAVREGAPGGRCGRSDDPERPVVRSGRFTAWRRRRTPSGSWPCTGAWPSTWAGTSRKHQAPGGYQYVKTAERHPLGHRLPAPEERGSACVHRRRGNGLWRRRPAE